MRVTTMEINTKEFNNNISKIKKYVGSKILMPVIKANAYGTYINKRLDMINKFDIVAVAITDEATELRKIGYTKDILLLNQPPILELKTIIKYNIIVGLSDESFINEIINQKQKIKVHLEIETGMNRTGIKLNNLKAIIDKLKQNQHIIVEGVYTHLSSADSDDEYTKEQLRIFKECVTLIKNKFNTIKYIHSSASNGLLNYHDNVSNTVRPGIIMYGYESSKNTSKKINIIPIAKLKTKITFLKTIDKFTSVGYSRKFISSNEMKIATIPIGYADGFRRELSNKGFVIINNQKAKIVGNICMDSCMIDVTNIKNVHVGSDVYIWDNKKRTLEDIANECNTINYEILSTISSRVPREFK